MGTLIKIIFLNIMFPLTLGTCWALLDIPTRIKKEVSARETELPDPIAFRNTVLDLGRDLKSKVGDLGRRFEEVQGDVSP
jgi:hypothetical protein